MSDKYIMPDGTEQIIPKNDGETFRLLEAVSKETENGTIYQNDKIDNIKTWCIEQIASKTQELISVGYTHSDGYTYSTKPEDQLNWTSIKASLDEITFPFAVGDIDGFPRIYNTKEELNAVYLGGLVFKNTHLAKESELRSLIEAATNIEDIKTIMQDNNDRTNE